MSDLFGGAAAYYARYRPGYGPEVIEHLARVFGRGARVLDLGCGPGTVAIPLAPLVTEVVAVDPDPDMLATGRRLAGARASIRWLPGDSTSLRALPAFHHVVMGRSFHWMDRGAVLSDLDELLPPDGVVALLGPTREPREPPWEPVVRPVREKFGLLPRFGGGSFQASGEHHQDVLAGSPFGRVEAAIFERRLEWDVDAVVGLQLSYSFSSPARLGGRLEAFSEAVRAALLAACPPGGWEERETTEALIARRP
ncbi:class I SAM-dependent methyltransferase [Nonomuraea sp. LPB2021202275-12-8]|uniref:class I SAM-dependent methyltransferase n=1 Tax=Nonomuraea sp. LPB2021202275-12-8 TaxID=3120159 RepID=UPI00300C9B56